MGRDARGTLSLGGGRGSISDERFAKWQRFIDNWTSDGFKAWVDLLATNLDEMAEAASFSQRAKMERKFFETMRYERLFWKLAFHGESW